MTASRHVAVDLGASSGRVVVGNVARGRVVLEQVHRFANRPVQLRDALHWDILGLYGGVLDGLTLAGRYSDLTSIAVDSWGVDYGLLDAAGALLGNPFHYRDRRTQGMVAATNKRITPEKMYGENGLQPLAINTIYQLAAAAGTPQLREAATMLLIPDLIAHWLTGAVAGEITIASTTGLLDVRARKWSAPLCALAGVGLEMLPELVEPGVTLGHLLPNVRQETGLPAVTVTAVGSHDTASAVVAVPMVSERAAYISLGTWALIGVELEHPVLTEASRIADFTNELGVDGRVRYHRNAMGLWLLQECLRVWNAAGLGLTLPGLLGQAAELPRAAVISVDDSRFDPPGDMPALLRLVAVEQGQRPPESPAQVVRMVVDSLAAAFAAAIRDVAGLSGRDVEVVHIVGGGAQNELLCQLTADACGLPVMAGPVEATAMGNVLVQARAHGTLSGELEVLRRLVAEATSPRRFRPTPEASQPTTRS